MTWDPGDDQPAIDRVVADFFTAFDNRDGRVPDLTAFVDLFVGGGVIAQPAGDGVTVAGPEEFFAPRRVLLTDGRLTGFHEWEVTATTVITGALAVRTSTYAKDGQLGGRPYGGTGTKHFQLARTAAGWRIVAVLWTDDEPPGDGSAGSGSAGGG